MRTHFVYRAFDAEGRLLYVGITANPRSRWATHRSQSEWAPAAVRFRVAGPYTEGAARDIEKAAILSERPRFNRQGNPNAPAYPVRRGRRDRALVLSDNARGLVGLRDRLQVTLLDLSLASGFSINALREMEAGQREVSNEALIELAHHIGVIASRQIEAAKAKAGAA